MSAKPETLFKKKVVKILSSLPHTKVFVIQQVAKRGDPDLLVCVKGKFVALELKRSGVKKGSPLQEHILTQVIKALGYARICTPENFNQILMEIDEL